MPYTKEQAHSEYLDVFGNKYEFLSGPKTGQTAEVKSYEVSPDGNTLYFIMTNNVKIDSKQFYDIMMSVGASTIQDPLYAAKVNGRIDVDLEEKLGIMSDEEEALLNQRVNQNKNNDNVPPVQPKQNNTITESPIDLILTKRKNKINVNIPIDVQLEFIDKITFDLINNTFDDAVEGIIKHFMNNIDTDTMQKNFEKSMRKYIFENFLNEEYVEQPETETIAEDPESGKTEILKWESDDIESSEDEDVEKK